MTFFFFCPAAILQEYLHQQVGLPNHFRNVSLTDDSENDLRDHIADHARFYWSQEAEEDDVDSRSYSRTGLFRQAQPWKLADLT